MLSDFVEIWYKDPPTMESVPMESSGRSEPLIMLYFISRDNQLCMEPYHHISVSPLSRLQSYETVKPPLTIFSGLETIIAQCEAFASLLWVTVSNPTNL